MSVGKSWGRSISGPVFGTIALILLLVQEVVTDAPTATVALKWGAWGTISIAVFFILIAQYHVWHEEHDARLAADEKLSAAADMRGHIWVKNSPNNPVQDQTRVASELTFHCDCANHGKQLCEISRVAIRISPPERKTIAFVMGVIKLHVVAPGRGFTYHESTPVLDLSTADLLNSNISINLIDSLGTEYLNTVTKVTSW